MELVKPRTFVEFFPDFRPRTLYRVADVFMCRYMFFELPSPRERQILLIGPYLSGDLSRRQVWEQGEKMGIAPKFAGELEHFYASLPVVREENHIFAMVSAFGELLWKGGFESADIERDQGAFMGGDVEVKLSEDNELLRVDHMERRYEYENKLIQAVSQGNVHKAESMMAGFSELAFEQRVADPLRNQKNYCIIMNTLLRKAAEQGGVHPVKIDSVSSRFAREIENIHSLSKMPEFMMEILHTYCRLVKRHSIKNYSPVVQKAIVKIEGDPSGDLGLAAMAKLSNVSTGYFSQLFKKETGRTLTEYVNHRRITLAKQLLKTTNLQIQTVAQHCGILDLNYFCRLFKKSVGKTPTQYRTDRTFEL